MTSNNKPDDGGWAWFDDGAVPSKNHGVDTEALPAVFAGCFRGNDGDAVIRYLRAITLDRALGPAVSDTALRHTEGQRQLVAHILALIERGRSGT